MLIARLRSLQRLLAWQLGRRNIATNGAPAEATDEEIAAARQWLSRLNPDTIPQHVCDFSFSRSSGPGGQNVNKVNSKATLKISLSDIQSLIPRLIWQRLLQSRYCTQRSEELVIQSDDSRKQSDNRQKCLAKLNDIIIEAGEEVVPGETSDSQKNRVKNLQRSSNEGRLKNKKFQSLKKKARKGTGRPDY